MVMNINWKAGLDRSPWRPESVAPAAFATGNGIAYDARNDASRIPLAFFYANGGAFIFNPVVGDWFPIVTYSPASNGAGSASVFHPSQGPGVGLLTGGSAAGIGNVASGTTTSIGLTTALPAAVGLNQLADRGDGVGFRMRVIGFHAAGSGKTEEVTITANTAGTTPTITFTPALTFTPASGDGYEILSGKLYCLLNGALGTTTWRSIDIATGLVTNLTNTNLAATIATDSFLLARPEVYVSNDRNPGDGFVDTGSTYNNAASKCCIATASSTTTLTCAALTAPATPSLATNEYRNFQIRVVEDTGTPTAVGQRRNITSHTSGNTPVFTVPTFTVQPSATAKFVVEQNNDQVLARTSATTNMYNYSVGGNAWDAATTWVAGGSGNGAGVMMAPAFGITRDASGNRLQGQIFVFKGGATATLDLFDTTGGATGAWTAGITYGYSGQTFTTGTCGCYDPVTLGGKYFHISVELGSLSPGRMARFNVMTQTLEVGTYRPYPCSAGNPSAGQRMFVAYALDGTSKLANLYQMPSGIAPMFSQIVPV